MMADDLQSFIKEHKAKLAKDKEEVTPRSNRPQQAGGRKQWNKQPAQNMPIATEGDEDGETGLPVGGYEQRRRKLQDQRHQEYNQFLSQHAAPQPRPKTRLSTPEETGLPLGQYEEKRKKLQAERGKEYNKMIYQRNDDKRKNGFKENIPPKPGTPEPGLIGQLGKYDNKRRQLQEERKKEYNQVKGQQSVRSGRQADSATPEEFTSSLPGLRDRDSAQRRREEQKREYNEYLRSQPGNQERAAPARPPARLSDDEDEGMTLPGVRDHASAEREKMYIRNKEYNQYLQSRQNKGRGGRDADDEDDYARNIRDSGPRKGWATPTYEEILDKKRREERNYRQDDPYYDGGMRASRSESNLYVDDRKFQNLDKEYETNRRVRFRNPDRGMDPDTEFSNWPSRGGRDQDRDRGYPSRERSRDREPDYRPPVASRGRSRGNYEDDDKRTGSTLPIGNEARMSATQRKKEAYRRELEQQMQERTAAKKRERAEEMKVDSTGAMDVGRRPDRTELPARRSPPPARRSPPPTRNNPYHDDFSPRAILYDDMPRGPGRPPGGGILENGFHGLLGNNMPLPRTTPAPSGYLLPSGLTPGVAGQPALGPYNSPLDEAYYYYGLRNPLDPGLAPGPGLAPQPNGLSAQQPSPRPMRDTIPPPQADRGTARRDAGAPRVPGMPFPTEDRQQKTSPNSKLTYQQELQQQIEEARMKKQRDKEDKERYDRKIEAEAAMYDPYGKGGGGAPMKDAKGNIIANLRSMRGDNEDNMMSGRPSAAPPPVVPTLALTSPRDPGQEAPTHARGGHGIFGVAKTDEQKTAADRYKDELKQQIEEKKRKQMEEKEKEKQEEEREMKRLEDQQKRIKQEFEEELRKQKEKEDRTRKENEELQRAAEEKRKQLEQQRMAAEDKRLEEQRREQDEKFRQRQQERTASPPIPALRSKTEPPNTGDTNGPSSRAPSRSQSADVLAQLAKMRAQLQNERKRVENALDGQKKDVDVADPRAQKPPSRNVDIFEIARNKEPVSVRRDPAERANPKHLKDFQNLKHKGNTGSRQELRTDYPDDPTSSDTLEQQQLALLRAQEDKLRALKAGPSPYEKALPNMNPKDLGLFRDPTLGSITPLQADSEFIAVPDDDEVSLRNHRNTPSRTGRRNRSQTPTSYKDPMGSVISLDPDAISRKNDQRLKKLKNLTGDDISTGDPDDILDRFMSKQKHNRPPSGQTLNDDTWLQSKH